VKNAKRWWPWGLALLLLAPEMPGTEPSADAPAPVFSWHRGLFRVNSDISSGTESVETIARKAEAEGMAFAVFTDQFLVRAEYGLPPFRRVAKVSREQDSVARHGIDAYLGRLNRLQLEHPGLIVIPGVDVAPALWWTGNPLRGTLTAHQFSQQMTIFGPQDAAFYRDLPVIFNTRPGCRFPGTLVALLPLLLAALGWRLIRTPPRAYYEDCQGNRYTGPRWPRYLLGSVLVLVGVLWTVDNRPFTVGPSWSPYRPPGRAPYQAVCDHVRARGGPEAGVVWAHPEITMRQGMPGVRLVTVPYLDDVENTFGHNGLAGIYGDAFRAHLPGQAWDRMLAQHARGKRRERPVVVGESDYHGGDRALPLIQTVVRVAAPGRRAILRALLDGNSYALYRQPEHAMTLDEAVVIGARQTASLGETLSWDGREPLAFHLRGHLDGPPPSPAAAARLTVVVDGREVASEMLALPRFDVTLPVTPEATDLQLHYVRFHIQGTGGQLIANPIFMQTEATP
jgi:hypothetical protein